MFYLTILKFPDCIELWNWITQNVSKHCESFLLKLTSMPQSLSISSQPYISSEAHFHRNQPCMLGSSLSRISYIHGISNGHFHMSRSHHLWIPRSRCNTQNGPGCLTISPPWISWLYPFALSWQHSLTWTKPVWPFCKYPLICYHSFFFAFFNLGYVGC